MQRAMRPWLHVDALMAVNACVCARVGFIVLISSVSLTQVARYNGPIRGRIVQGAAQDWWVMGDDDGVCVRMWVAVAVMMFFLHLHAPCGRCP